MLVVSVIRLFLFIKTLFGLIPCGCNLSTVGWKICQYGLRIVRCILLFIWGRRGINHFQESGRLSLHNAAC